MPAAVVLAFPAPGEDDAARDAWWLAVGRAAAVALGVGGAGPA
ncbi:unannotated protein [freshwater metagenome]|uniref:Unannotated protein n=1 Tax=freshwater metagenome TaxID=449393 RepID=A0A6J7IXV5_9ZZZZ